jgi:hypothetical protein
LLYGTRARRFLRCIPSVNLWTELESELKLRSHRPANLVTVLKRPLPFLFPSTRMDKYVVPIAPAGPSLASEAGSKRRAEEPAVVILCDDEDRQEDSDADSGEGESYLPNVAKKVKPAPVKTPAKKQTIKDIEGHIAALQEQAAHLRAARKPAQPKVGVLSTPITVTFSGGLGSKAAKSGGTFPFTFVPSNVTLPQLKAECRRVFGKHPQDSIGFLVADPAAEPVKPLAIADLRDGMTVHVTYKYAPGNPQPMNVLLGGRGGFQRRRFGFGWL